MKDIYSKHIQGSKLTGKKASIAGIVIHNDYGSMTPNQYLPWLYTREQNGTHVNGWASVYVNKDETLWYHPTDYVEWHCGNNWANSNLIGFEVCQSHPAAGLTDAQFKLNEEATFKVAAAVMKSYGLPVNRTTVNLHRQYFGTSCPHRSWDMHVGKNAPDTLANRNKLKDYFISRIKHYYNGGTTPKPPKTTWKWSGKATAKKGVSPIAAKKKPGLNEPALPSSNNILAGQYINFFSVTKKDGYWWAEFEYPTNPKAGRFYCALGPITHKDEKLENETKLWFDLKITSKK
ncbi:N-acetylmuramoyl-L-alanine amidase [Mammaliicoccus sciuri]|uniref:peptidoglycan recognition protein family protein n=1 Tax=Mammaliicoccus sciuri TaxID=1296 RepID=UPI0021D2190A|nr:N-acetylmuramoyl-L-alanine amidase [Mammaliicoccus sciuri]UXU83284.1 N-acetylmuramoyl-L-alanine amidase [Mammaliicoccus sciuri]UXU93131.1 N-acetylmuramoyl-L-alanine amidase [Mammaliicoccus sciuri]UXV15082.1 N-acetylmuramoyl-L-alanine amidase [Mammaliicoccus sciuri]UXV23345.1 N-acetylmuramoyl-L-alanine amidase [Mammaliicoccus sciuri]UXV26123.1 N-acetylmuramoyl-L-alanine amidase [Mammaliicoccus sciuri]